MRAFLVGLLAWSFGCSDAGRPEASPSEGGAAEESKADAAVPDMPSARSVAAAALQEYDRTARLVCPCQVEAGGFASLDQCIAKTGYDKGLIECLSAAFVPFDSEELREQLRCQAQSVKARNDCLETSSCAVQETSRCSEQAPTCPMFDPQLLTQVLQACPGAHVLSR